MAATVTLTLVKGRVSPGEYLFDERATCILGRSPDCSPRLPDDEHHRTVSRHHCLLDVNPPSVRIRDFGSRNGTFVNGQKIGQRSAGLTPEEGAAGTYPEHDLADGDEIRLGDTVFRVGITYPATLVSAQCAKCGRELGEQAGGGDGPVLCAGCQSEPAAVLKLLLDLAADGNADLSAVSGYTMSRELGRGGMGAVYLARHAVTGEEVALKVMLPKVAASATARARFLREVALTRALRHPHIVPLLDAGFAGGAFYLTTAYCAQGSLDRLLAGRPEHRLPVAEAVPIALQALDGLAHAHSQGVVHRDLSPSNILLRKEPDGALTAMVSDFGLAKAFDQAGLSGLTSTGATAGKPSFLHRQQVVNFSKSGPEVDLWALAACLYHMLTGALPRDFPRNKDPWVVVLQDPPVPIRHRLPVLPQPLAEVIDRALREGPGEGYGDAPQLRAALAPAARG